MDSQTKGGCDGTKPNKGGHYYVIWSRTARLARCSDVHSRLRRVRAGGGWPATIGRTSSTDKRCSILDHNLSRPDSLCIARYTSALVSNLIPFFAKRSQIFPLFEIELNRQQLTLAPLTPHKSSTRFGLHIIILDPAESPESPALPFPTP